VYVLPTIVIAVGLFIAVTLVRRWVRGPEVEPVEDDAAPMTASDRRAVLKAVARLREEEAA